MQSRIAIQESMQKLGFYQGGLDGSLGPQTERAISAYQRSIRVRQTGFLTAAQVKALVETAAAGGNDLASVPRVAQQSAGDSQATGGAPPTRLAQNAERGRFQDDRISSHPVPSTLAQALGLKTLRGDILLASEVSGFKGYAAAIDRLARLLWLKTNPALIDDPQKTVLFTWLLPPDEKAQYAEGTDWKGRDQFERDDSRERFLKEQRARILALIPEIPLTLAEALPFSLGQYDRATRQLAIRFNRYSPWPSGAYRVEVPAPFDYPNAITVPENIARSLVAMQTERARKGIEDKLTALARYKLQAVRALDGGVLLELVALDLKIYDSGRLENVAATIPLPDNAITENRDTSPNTAPVAVFDAMYPRLLAIKLKPELAQNDSFVMESFRIRREIEKRVVSSRRHNHPSPITNLPLVMSAPMLNSEVAPSPSDIEPFKRWLAAAVQSVPDTVRLYMVCPAVSDARTAGGHCVLPQATGRPGSTAVDLSKLVLGAGFNWEFAQSRGPWIEPAVNAASARYPNAAGHPYLEVGRDLPTVMSLSANPHWYELIAPGMPAEMRELSIDLKVVGTSVLPARSGEGFLSIEVQPTSISYKLKGAPQRVDVPDSPTPVVAASSASTASDGKFDVLGVKVGMPLEGALKALQPFADQPGMQRGTETRVNDPFFEHAVIFLKRDPRTNELLEKFIIFHAPSLDGSPVIAAGRYLNITDRNYADDKAAAAAILPSISQKYGQPDTASGDGRSSPLWAVNPVVKAQLKRGINYQHECSFFKYRNFYETSGQFNSAEMKGNCGEMVGAMLSREFVTTLVINDHLLNTLRQKMMTKNARPAPPPIKF